MLDDTFYPLALAFMGAGLLCWLVGYGATALVAAGGALYCLKHVFAGLEALGDPLA